MCKHEFYFVPELWNINVCKHCHKTISEIDLEQQLSAANARVAEIAKKDRMINKAIDTLFILPDRDECPDAVFCPIILPNTPDIGVCRRCWRKWLEKEAEVQSA